MKNNKPVSSRLLTDKSIIGAFTHCVDDGIKILRDQEPVYTLTEQEKSDLTDIVLVAINEVTKSDPSQVDRYHKGVDISNMPPFNPYVVSSILHDLGYEENENGFITADWKHDYYHSNCDVFPPMQISGESFIHSCRITGEETDDKEYTPLENNPEYAKRIEYGYRLLKASYTRPKNLPSADNSDDGSNSSDYQSEDTRNKWRPGDTLTIGGISWAVLDVTPKGYLCLADSVCLEMFDPASSNWAFSTLRTLLHTHFFMSRLGIENYWPLERNIDGNPNTINYFDNLSLLTLEEYHKYRDLIPQTVHPWWLLTPSPDHENSVYVVGMLGNCYLSTCCNINTVRPACLFDFSFLDQIGEEGEL